MDSYNYSGINDMRTISAQPHENKQQANSNFCKIYQKGPKKQGPPKPRLEWAADRGQRCRYCLSYTAVLVTFLPAASVLFKVTVRVLPSAETTARPLTVTLPSFLLVSDKVWSLTFVYDLVSVLGSPVTG